MKKNSEKNTEIKSENINYNCVSCGNSYKLVSTLGVEDYSIDVCSNCHPFYLGVTGAQRAKGRSEKLMNKFNMGKIVAKSKKESTSN